MKTMHAYFSEKQKALGGSSLYKKPNGKEVEVSEVCDLRKMRFNFEDMKYLGRVIHHETGGMVKRLHDGEHVLRRIGFI